MYFLIQLVAIIIMSLCVWYVIMSLRNLHVLEAKHKEALQSKKTKLLREILREYLESKGCTYIYFGKLGMFSWNDNYGVKFYNDNHDKCEVEFDGCDFIAGIQKLIKKDTDEGIYPREARACKVFAKFDFTNLDAKLKEFDATHEQKPKEEMIILKNIILAISAAIIGVVSCVVLIFAMYTYSLNHKITKEVHNLTVYRNEYSSLSADFSDKAAKAYTEESELISSLPPSNIVLKYPELKSSDIYRDFNTKAMELDKQIADQILYVNDLIYDYNKLIWTWSYKNYVE